jgi:drug/metabolite transporter (DMT)-like permease
VLQATAVGAVAVLLWATLALLTTSAARVPPFQLVAMAFAIAFLVGAGTRVARRSRGTSLRQWPLALWLIGVGGLFGYHFCYFVALRMAPPADANLINYLWPLLIVLFSAALPGERLRWWHVAGVLCGLAGTVLIISGGGGLSLRPEFALGYGAALAAAVIWATYSVMSRRFAQVPTDAVGAFCGMTAVLALLSHVALETWVWPQGWEWLAILALGLGPVGSAFFFWDHGVKRGDIRVLGTISYMTPLLSTGLLVASDRTPPTAALGLACLLITGGAVLASWDLLFRRIRR